MADCAYCTADAQLVHGGLPICIACADRRESNRRTLEIDKHVRVTVMRRNLQLDFLRGVAILMVMVCHSIYMVRPPTWDAVNLAARLERRRPVFCGQRDFSSPGLLVLRVS